MTRELDYKAPQIEFDDRLAAQLTRQVAYPPTASDPAAGRANPFAGYSRSLTPEGGILILYRDCVRGGLYALLRVGGWGYLTYEELRLVTESSLSAGGAVIEFTILAAATLFLVTRKIKARHRVEIRHDRMVLDAKHVFWAKDIGRNWPKLEKIANDPNRMVIAGICGTRYVKYMTANRIDANDRTPEVLAADLQDAMQQLWGRDELVFG